MPWVSCLPRIYLCLFLFSFWVSTPAKLQRPFSIWAVSSIFKCLTSKQGRPLSQPAHHRLEIKMGLQPQTMCCSAPRCNIGGWAGLLRRAGEGAGGGTQPNWQTLLFPSLLFHDEKIHFDTIDHNKLIMSFSFLSLLSQELSPFHLEKSLTHCTAPLWYMQIVGIINFVLWSHCYVE